MQTSSQNKMAVQPIAPLMFRIGLPIVLSMILQAAYNVVDSAYLARMTTGGEDALTALSLAFPVQLFMVAVSIGTGVGTNALLAKLLGLGLAFHLHLNVEIKNNFCYFKPDRRTILGIYAIGLPAIISQALLTVMTYSLNLILGGIPQVGQNAVTVYGLYYKIQQLIIFAAFGVRDAITPIVSFNYGAQNRQRVKDGIRWGLIYTSILMLAGCLSVELFAAPLAGLFSLSETTLPMCIDCMRIVSLGFVFAGLCIAFQGVFQALECGIESLVISLCRQVLFVLPPVWLLSRMVTGAGNVRIVWVPLAVGEMVTLCIALVMFRRVKKSRVDSIPE